METFDENYTWADYMNDVTDGKKSTGWLWRAFHIPSGPFIDANGHEVSLEANRIVPYNIYVPTKYDENETRLTYMLHGGTGNENMPTYRIILRGMPVDQYAEDYNYIMVSPNGWTQNPMWRENQALYSFKKASEMVMEEFPVDTNKVFITGNSLGGKGAIEIAMRLPEMFRAMAPTSPKIGDRIAGKTVINIEDTIYKLSDIEDMPTMLVQGTADTTTSYYFQIGNKEVDGVIVTGIMPYLNDATYIAVEQGHHSYSYGSVLTAIFDFFESVLDPYEENYDFDTLYLYKKNKKAFLDDDLYKLDLSTDIVGDTVMVALSDLEKIYGEDFKAYSVEAYDRDPEKTVNYWTIIHNNKTLNFTLGETEYRKNLERYKKDVLEDLIKAGRDDLALLDNAPQFSASPYKKGDEIFVPAVEVLNALGRNVSILTGTRYKWGNNR